MDIFGSIICLASITVPILVSIIIFLLSILLAVFKTNDESTTSEITLSDQTEIK